MSFVATIEADINKWTPNLDKAGKDISNFANNTKKDLDKVSRAQKGAGTVAMEFNRIIQDAPFGMMGISNNLTQLTDNYKNYAQSVKQAALEQGKSVSNFQIFKGAVAGILSPINLFSLGISAVTSGLILYQQWQQRAKKVTKESTDKIKELVDNLNSLSTAMYKAAQSSGNEVAQLNTLYKITTDVNQSTNARKKAAKDLIDQYPTLFGKFSTEQVMLGKAKTAYDEVSKSIIATARAQAAYGQISEKAGQQLAIDETNNGIREQISLLNKRLEIEKRNIEASTSSAAGNAGVGASSAAAYGTLAKLEEKVLGLNKSVSSNLLERAKLQEQINKLEEFAVVNQAKTIDLTDKNNNKTKEHSKSQKDYREELDSTIASFGIYEYQIKDITAKFDKFRENATKAGAGLKELGIIANEEAKQKLDVLKASMSTMFTDLTTGLSSYKLTGLSKNEITIPIKAKVDADFSALNDRLENVRSNLRELSEEMIADMASIIHSGIEGTIGNLGDAIAGALTNNENIIGAIGASLLGSLGGIMVDLGKLAIMGGVTIEAIKKSLEGLVGFPAIAAGAALVAVGSMFKAGASNLANSMGSGSASSYNSGYSASTGQNFNAFPRGSYYNNDKQVVELKLKNGELNGAIKWGNNRNTRIK